jgi:lipopolysaccharide export system permease protein
VEDIIGKGLEFTTIIELLSYATAGLVPMALPLAILLASLMTFGNFGENYELTAIKAAGISLQKVMLPLVFSTLLISFGAFFFSNYVLPYTNLQTGSLLYDIGRKRPEVNIKEGVFSYSINGFAIKVMRKSHETKMMYDFMIYDHTNGMGNKRLTLADSGTIRMTTDKMFMEISLYAGENYFEVNEKSRSQNEREYPQQHDVFKRETLLIPLDGMMLKRTDTELFKHHYQMMNIRQLKQSEDSMQNVLNNRQKDFAANILRSDYMVQKRPTILRIPPSEKAKIDSMRISEELYMPNFEISKREQLMVVGKDTLPLQYVPLTKMRILVNTDSIFRSISSSDKRSITNSAQQNVRRIMQNLDATQEQLKSIEERIRRHRIEWHRKFTLSFACFIFFFIGAPLGAIIRKGGLGLPVVISVLFFIFYYVVSLFGDKFAREGFISPLFGMWLASGILLPVGAWLTYKATTDSSLFNMDAYSYAFERFINRLLKKKPTETNNSEPSSNDNDTTSL